jgi:hypothetical protein
MPPHATFLLCDWDSHFWCVAYVTMVSSMWLDGMSASSSSMLQRRKTEAWRTDELVQGLQLVTGRSSWQPHHHLAPSRGAQNDNLWLLLVAARFWLLERHWRWTESTDFCWWWWAFSSIGGQCLVGQGFSDWAALPDGAHSSKEQS